MTTISLVTLQTLRQPLETPRQMKLLRNLICLCEQQAQLDDEPTDPAYITEPDFFRVYAFLSIDEVCRASRALQSAYDADNSLYKDPQHNRYYLVLHKGDHSPQTFNKVCNILSEYAESIHCNAGTESHYKEHFTLILAKHALQALKQL